VPFLTPWFFGGLPLLLLLYYVLPKKAQWPLLLVASMGFYAMASWQGLAFVLFTVASSYIIALRIDKLKRRQKAHVEQQRDNMSRDERKAFNAREKKRQRGWLIVGMALNFGLLAAVKIWETDWVIDRLGLSLIVPLGISFFTFRIMGYLIDVFWGKAEVQRNPLKLGLFTMFFPYVLMGPISRYDHVSKTLLAEKNIDWNMFGRGLQRMIWGYFKVMVIGFRLIIAVRHLADVPTDYSGMFAFWAMLVWGAALYADFTGGIDIAMGIGECLGVKMEENFLSPFRAKDIFEYWRRWHITMGTWFRDYVFYPMSVAKPVQKMTSRMKSRSVKRKIQVHVATLITWFTTGIWHGVAWNFIVWGLANGVVIMVSQELKPLYERFHKRFPRMQGRGYDAFQVVRTFLLLTLIRSFDIYMDVPRTFRLFGSFITRPQFGEFFRYIFSARATYFGLSGFDWLVAALAVAVLIAVPWFRREETKRPPAIFWAAMVLVTLVFGIYGLGFDIQDFFYMQF